MPELPDIEVYIRALENKVRGQKLQKVRLGHPFLLKTVDPPVPDVEGKRVLTLRRLGKRIALGLEDDFWLVIHLMLAGRLHWKPPGFKLTSKMSLAAFDFAPGSLVLMEAGSKRRASLHILRGDLALQQLDPGGLEALTATLDDFTGVLKGMRGTVKKVLTNPRYFSGIGNAYSDEILHRAGMSPFALVQNLDPDELARLFVAIGAVMQEWTQRLLQEVGEDFPEKVTAFRPEMAVHGKFGQPCPVCGTSIERIRYAGKKETNYCPRCQTQGRLLADRVMSRLLKGDRPRHVDELKKPSP